MQDRTVSRRQFHSLALLCAATALSGCMRTRTETRSGTMIEYRDRSAFQLFPGDPSAGVYGRSPELEAMYGAREDGGFLIPAVPYDQIDPRYYRQRVANTTGQPPGTIVVDTASRFLYLTEGDGTAMRYGVGIGRDGFAWQGEGVIQWRQKWPVWTPPDEMIARQPELIQYSADNGGMQPGLSNPLGARALYIFQNGEDTLYRLHGSPEWNSIGRAVSSGCVRLMNQDVIDLYERVPNKARIVVWQ